MKIIQLVSSLGIGGAEKFVVDLSIALQSQGCSVDVIVLDRAVDVGKSTSYEEIMVKKLIGSGINVYFIKSGRKNLLRSCLNLYQLVNKIKPDVIHSHLLIWSLLLSFLPKKYKVIFTQHTNRLKVAKVHKYWLRYKIDHYISICDEVNKTCLQLVDQSRVTKVINGIDFSGIKQKKHSLYDSANKHKFITVARLEPVKNLSLLIKATHILFNRGFDFRVVIVGDGSSISSLKKQVLDLNLTGTVEFLGSRNDVPELLQSSDSFVLTSFYEGFSIALIEALATGLNVIATDVGGNKELLQNGKFGQLILSDDVLSLSNAMENSINNLCYLNNYEERDLYLEQLSVESCAKNHIKIYS